LILTPLREATITESWCPLPAAAASRTTVCNGARPGCAAAQITGQLMRSIDGGKTCMQHTAMQVERRQPPQRQAAADGTPPPAALGAWGCLPEQAASICCLFIVVTLENQARKALQQPAGRSPLKLLLQAVDCVPRSCKILRTPFGRPQKARQGHKRPDCAGMAGWKVGGSRAGPKKHNRTPEGCQCALLRTPLSSAVSLAFA
jgi:hypothetical protein